MKKIFSRLGIFFVVSATLSVLAAGTAFAAAPTGFTSQVFQDSDANGTVDQVVVVINGGEALTTCTVTDTEISTDWTYVANSLTGSTLASSGNTHSCVTATATVTLKLTGAPANTTSAATLPTIAYDNDDADNSIANASGNLGTVTAANAADDANPIITLAQTQDTDNDGKLDALKLTFSETMDTTAFNGYGANSNFTPSTLALAVVTGEAVVSTDATQTTLGETDTDNLVYIAFTENASTCSSSDQTGCDTELTNQDLTLTGTSATMDDLAAADNDLGNVVTATIAETDLAKPVLMKVLAGTSSGVNTIAFTFSEAVTTCTGASTATCGNLTSVGTIAGLGNFGTNGNILVATGKNTVAGSTTDTITVSLAAQSGGFLESSDDVVALTVPSSTIAADATAGVVDAASNQANASGAAVTATTLPSAAWDITPPTISSGVLSDSFANDSSFVAGGTFNTGSDGRADQIIFTASESLRGSTLNPDSADGRDDWTITAAASEYGTLTVIKAAPATAGDTGTTFTLNFSGANLYYANPTTFNVVNAQEATPTPGFTDRAGNPLTGDPTVTLQTYRVCFTGLTCTGSTLGNVAVITSTITQPANTADVTGPAAAKDLKAEVVEGKEVKLTWTDPTDADLSNIKIYRVKNSETETSLEVLGKGVKTYTDKAVAKGDKVKYRLSGFDTSGNEGTKTDYTTEATVEVVVVEEEEEVVAEPITTNLLAVGESGVSGTATIEEVEGKVKVTLALTGAAEGATQPAHIHMGTCAATGDIKHNLTAVAAGASVTTLELTLAELQAQYPLYVNVHASDADLATTVACGNIEAETVLPEVELEGEVVEEAVAVVDGTITEAVSVQNAETGAAVSISAETTATVDGAAYTGTIAPPVATEKEVTAPEGSKAASAVFSVDTGVEGSVVFDKPVTLVFPATGTVSTKKVYTMYTVSADGKLSEPVVCAVKTLDGEKVFECKSSHLTEFVVLESEPEVAEEEEEVAEAPFVDTKTHWSKDFVADLYAKKVVSGKDATHYAPDAYISRAEFTKIVIVGLGISVKEAKDIKDMPFKDVKAGDWALPYIDAAKTAGVIGGYKDGTFKSDAMINRAEAMKILFEAAKIETKNAAAAKFSDVKQSEWYAKYVNYAAEKKIVSGYKDGTFGTDKNLTRGEVAKIVSLLLKDM